MYTAAICICTYQRPTLLRNLLHSLIQVTSADPFKIIVVDNDEQQTAKPVIQALKEQDIDYVIEPRTGLSFARNAAVRAARQWEPEFLVWLDDDQIVKQPDWLASLISTAEKYPHALITGPISPVLNENIQGPIRVFLEASLFARPKDDRTGTTLEMTGMANTLLPLSSLQCLDDPFSLDHNDTGGEDTELFFTLQSQGYEIVWCKDAGVGEIIDEDRATVKHVFRMVFATTAVYNSLTITSARQRTIRLLKGSAKVMIGSSHFMFGLVRPNERIPSIVTIARGCGDIAGAFRLRPQFYRRKQGFDR